MTAYGRCIKCGTHTGWYNEQAKEWRCEDCFPRDRPKQFQPKKLGRNDMCPCGSGKKYKKCCL